MEAFQKWTSVHWSLCDVNVYGDSDGDDDGDGNANNKSVLMRIAHFLVNNINLRMFLMVGQVFN